MKKIILLALLTIGLTAQSQTTVPQKVTGTVVATPTGTQAVSGTVSITNGTLNVTSTVSTVTGGTIHTGKFIGVSSTTIAVTTTPYSVGDNLAGIQTVTNTSRTSGGSSEIKSFSLWDKANQKVAITVLFWSASPSGTYTDNAAMVITGDDPKFLGKFEISSADYTTIGANAVATIPVNLKIKPKTGTSIYYTMVTSGTPTFATNGLVSTITTEQD